MDTREFRTLSDRIWDVFLFSGCLLLIVGAVILGAMLLTMRFAAAGIVLLVDILLLVFEHHAMNRDDRRIRERKQAYRDKYCSTVSVDGGELGELLFERDTKNNILILSREQLKDHFSGGFEIYVEGDSTDMEVVLNFIRRTIRDRKIIVEGLTEYVREVYLDEGITEDENGEHIDEDYIVKKLEFDRLEVYTDSGGKSSASLSGGMDVNIMDHISEHGLTTEFKDDGTYEHYSG